MSKRRHARRYPALLALLIFGGLAALPWLHPLNATPPWVLQAKTAVPVKLPPAPPKLAPVKLSSFSEPVDPRGPRARVPAASSTVLSDLVTSQNNLMRRLLNSSYHITTPTILDLPNSLPALVLPARPAPYTLADLATAGVAVPWDRPGWYLLADAVFVAPSATLDIGGAGLGNLLLGSSGAGFTWIATWGGTITLAGSATNPLSVAGWDEAANHPAQPSNAGRPYIRAIGGQLNAEYVHFSNLGFWSGPTGGVAWTGTSGVAASGEAIGSTFTGDTYGAFASDSYHVRFIDDLFESNQLDGLRLHRGADNSTATGSAAVRNGEDGFVVSRADDDVLRGDVAENNGSDGFLLDGEPVDSGASPSGRQSVPSTGSVLARSKSAGNGHYGVEVDGGVGTVVEDNAVCSSSTAISLRLGAVDTSVVGNQVACGSRVDLAVGPAVTDTTVSGNSLSGARIGILIRTSPNIRLLNNRLAGLSIFGIALHGASPGVSGDGNVIAGDGFSPVEAADGASSPSLANSNLSAWKRRTTPSVIGYLRFHPLLALWLMSLFVVAVSVAITRTRRRPPRPYAHIVSWQGSQPPALPAAATPRLARNGHGGPPPMHLAAATGPESGRSGDGELDGGTAGAATPAFLPGTAVAVAGVGEISAQDPGGDGIPATIAVGVEVAQRGHPTAAVILESQLSRASSGQDLVETSHVVRWIERVPAGATFTAIVNRIGTAADRAKVLGESSLVVDATSLPLSALDMLRWRSGLPVRPVLLSPGKLEETASHKIHRLGSSDLLVSLQTVLDSGRLAIDENAPLNLREELERQLGELGKANSPRPILRDHTVDAGSDQDLATALCLAVWWAERVSQGEAFLDWWDRQGQPLREKGERPAETPLAAGSRAGSENAVGEEELVSSRP